MAGHLNKGISAIVWNVIHNRNAVCRGKLLQSSIAIGDIRARKLSSGVEAHIKKSPKPDIVIPNLPIHEFIWLKHEKWADKIAIECAITQRRYTYSEARVMSRKLASVLQNSFKLVPGDCVAILSPNLPEYPFILLGASEAGVVSTTINPLYTPDEVAKQLQDSKAKLIFTTPLCYANAVAATQKIGRNLPILVIKDSNDAEIPKGAISFFEVVDSSSGEVHNVSFDVHANTVLPYSSGTTGLPKGVQLTHHNLVSNLAQMDAPGVRLLIPTTESQQDVVLALLPLFHIYGMVVVTLTSLAEGGKLVTLPRFDPKTFLQTIVQYQTSMLYLVPPLILFLGGHPAVTSEHLKPIRNINSGAAPIGLTDIERLNKKAPHVKIYQGYGMTETSPVALMTDHSRYLKYASTGVPVPNTSAMIVDPNTGNSLPENQVGELLIKGPQVMKGYLNREDANNDIFRREWLRTGDLAYYDEEGDFFVVDRLKELIKVKGFQVAPAELEEILRNHPKVADAAVIGVSDERAGEVPKAFVVAKQGQKLDFADISKFVANQVAEYKQISGGIVELPAIPKSAAGKILRKELRAEFGKK